MFHFIQLYYYSCHIKSNNICSILYFLAIYIWKTIFIQVNNLNIEKDRATLLFLKTFLLDYTFFDAHRHPSSFHVRCPIFMIFLNYFKEKFQHRMSTRYVALKLSGKRKKLEGKEGKDRRGVKVQQQLPRTIINHQERDNRIVQPTGEQLSLRWALNVHVTRCYCSITKKRQRTLQKINRI